MIELTRNQIAKLRGCTPSTVSKAHLPKTEGGGYDLLDSEVKHFVTAPAISEALEQYKKTIEAGYEDNSLEALEAEEKKANIALKKKRERKLDREHEIEIKNLHHTDQVVIMLGAIASGIRSYLFPVGERVARGDHKLQKRIDKEITKAIIKIKETTAAELKKESEKIIKAMEGKS